MKTTGDEEIPNEKEALATGLALVNAKWDGKSDFDKGMRLLQQKLGIVARNEIPESHMPKDTPRPGGG